MITQSVGVPSTTWAPSSAFLALIGRWMVRAWLVALCSRSGATTYVSKPAAFAARSRASMPALWIPSSFETRARITRRPGR